MPGMSLKKAIEVLKSELGRLEGENIREDFQAILEFIISKLSLLEQVEEGMQLRKEIAYRLECVEIGGDIGLATSQIIDLCNAHLIKKLDAEEIERIVISCKKQTEASCPHCNKNSTWTQINSYELSQAIKTYLSKKEKE